MKKILKNILIISIFLSILYFNNVLAYSNEFFEFDLPDKYTNMSFGSIQMFVSTENENRGVAISSYKVLGEKNRSAWELDDASLSRIISSFGDENNVLRTVKTKLGKEKTIAILVKDDIGYSDNYILYSGEDVYWITFMAESKEALDNDEFNIIKKSFKIKSAKTEASSFGKIALIASIVFAIGCLVYYLKSKMWRPRMHNEDNYIDYKNMTEEDFKRMDE